MTDPPPFIKIASALLSNNIHPIVILNSLQNTSFKAVDVLIALAIPIKVSDYDSLIKSTSTSLNTKVLDNTALSLLPSLLMLSAFHLLFTVVNLDSFWKLEEPKGFREPKRILVCERERERVREGFFPKFNIIFY